MRQLHYNRKRERQMREQEAQGISLWTDEFPKTVRVKIQNFMEAFDERETILNVASLVLRQGLGLRYLGDGNFSHAYECLVFIARCPNEYMPSVIEALYEGLEAKAWDREGLTTYELFINDLLSSERISFDLIEGRMIEKESQEIHAEVVAPTLTLLSHRQGFTEVEKAYQRSLERLSQRDTGGALTSAGTALQEMLEAVGCSGKTLGEQFRAAKTKELLTGSDSPLLEGVSKTLDWVSGVRNTRSDAHQMEDVKPEEAWMMVHIVGALMLRLAQGAE